MGKQPPPRLLPTAGFPDYSYVPGLWPHPHTLPSMSLVDEGKPTLPESPFWRDCRPYLLGIDLWNHGYYWEAHEAWESLWHAAGRRGPHAGFFKGLIQLAVAGVKAREGKGDGLVTHARRAGELFQELIPVEGMVYFGLNLVDLNALAGEIERTCPLDKEKPPARVKVMFAGSLNPESA